MKTLQGDFLGFTFNGYHSSDLGIVRVSDSNRYNENLLPEIKDGTVESIGADGVYFFNSFYSKKDFEIQIAYDNLSEEQFRKMRQVFGDKQVHDLIFDEQPYKVYKVKITTPPNLKYVCFNKDDDIFDRDYQQNRAIFTKEDLYGVHTRISEGRVYKGEGTIKFTAYSPFARSRFKYADDYTLQNIHEWNSENDLSSTIVYHNIYDWIDSAKLKLSNSFKTRDTTNYVIDVVGTDGVMYYNPGDLPTSFYLDFTSESEIKSFSGLVITDTFGGKSLSINGFELYEDNGFRINSKLNLIEGLILQNGEYITSGRVYNEYIEEGDFFKLPITTDLEWLSISSMSSSDELPFNITIKYDYLYY